MPSDAPTKWMGEAPSNRRTRISLAIVVFVGLIQLYSTLNGPGFGGSPNEKNQVPEHLPYGEQDNLQIGKRCIYNKHMHSPWKYLRVWFLSPWICQECSHENGCRPLKRQGRCRGFPRYLDSGSKGEVPRVSTFWSPFSSQKSAMHLYVHDGHKEYQQEYPICSAKLSHPCFDLTKCSSEGPLKVYSHGGATDEYLRYAANAKPNTIQIAANASDACLLVLGMHSFSSPDDIWKDPHWNSGQNHFVFNNPTSCIFCSHKDRPFNDKLSFGTAAVTWNSMDDAYIREGYDIPLVPPPLWKPNEGSERMDIHRPRKYLLSFKGNIMLWEQRSWQHRWIASEYWFDEPDVHVDTKCKGYTNKAVEYKNNSSSDYGNLLLNSTFFFCPGGGGVHSHRFAETMLAGAIPVVTSDFLPPFHPEIDWSGCIIRVSEARVVDLPRIVRDIPMEEVKKRQRKCRAFADTFFPFDLSGMSKAWFTFSMEIWHLRVKNALRMQADVEEAEKLWEDIGVGGI